MISRLSRKRGFTLLEVMIATALLAILILGMTSGIGATQRSVIETSEQTIAANAANDALESCLLMNWDTSGGTPDPSGAVGAAQWAKQPLLSLYNSYIAANAASPPLPVPAQRFCVVGPGMVPGNTFGSIIVREPTATEAPAYNLGLGKKYTGAATPTASNIPNALRAQSGGPTLLVIVVEVYIPSRDGKSGTYVKVQSWRHFL